MLGGMVFEMAAVVSKVGMVRVSVEMDMKEGVRKVPETFKEEIAGEVAREVPGRSVAQRGEQEGPGEKETRKILRTLEKAERKKRERDEQDREGDQDVGDVEDVREVFEIVEVAGGEDDEQSMEVNEECGGGGGEGDCDDDGLGDGEDLEVELDPEMVNMGRKDEVEFMVNKLGIS